MRKTRFALFQSMIALLLCFSMLVGTTFAWFTDGVSSGTNTIAAGVLDVEMEYLDAAGTWQKVTEATEVLDKNALWEPGYTEVAYLKVSNLGNLALKYGLGVQINGERGSINAAGESFLLSDHIRFGVIASETQQTYADRMQARNALTDVKFIKEGTGSSGVLYPQNSGENQPSETYITMVVFMPEEVGNAANYATGQQPPEIQLGIQLVATQAEYEADAFGTDYDAAADLPGFNFPENTFGGSVSADVKNENNQVAENVTIQGSNTNAVIPAGVQLEDGAEKLTLEVSTLDNSEANISLGKNDEMRSLDVHVEGVSADNTVPMEIYLKEAAAKGLNAGNLKVYHVENGTTVEMTQVDAFTAHNQFKYDPATGDIILYMATFSEVAVVADKVNAWNGKFDYTWYDVNKTDLTIVNADQLAGFGAIVGGMNSQTQDSFKDKTVKLIADVNLGDKESENNANLIFYPIGYYNSAKSYKKVSGGSVTSSVESFEGIFDGAGHTIANFYQNTWEMFGDYNDGYSGTPNHYKDAMGLFGYVLNGTVKNLTVSNFSSDGEYTPTGVIAAYADGNSTFENIAITNCNPRVYNTGNGGIIGIAGDTSDANDDHIILKNITVDNSNKISALWGSYDVACGGLVGMYRGNVDGNGNATGDTISFTNCHVAAQMDVYNDVCGNYQYYAYRYAGMIIGSVRHNTTTEDGKTIPNMEGISASGCTVNYGDWNDYYYCEFVKNGHPSYSGENDYKFSRVPNSEIDDSEGKENATCIGHNHTEVEDNQAIYLPFHQLFTGYGWGVNSVGLETHDGITVEGGTDIDVSVGDKKESVVKFESKLTADSIITESTEIKVGDLFSAIEGAEINASAVQVAVSALNDSGITAEYEADTNNWVNGTLTFNSIAGLCSVTIQDYEFCKPTTVILKDGKLYDVFVKKFTGNFLYRVGNQNEVSLGTLFAENGITVNDSCVKVSIAGVGGDYTPDITAWEKGTIKFSGTGVATVTIQDETYCNVTELKLEIVDAKNYPSPTAGTELKATANNLVLLSDISSVFEVSGRYTVYGNGFTLKYTGNGQYLNNGLKQGIVTVSENGTLDNLRIKASIYPASYLYYEEVKTGPSSVEGDKTRYHYQLSGVVAKGNATISNCYVFGARTNVFVDTGNVTIKDSILECGTLANIQIQSTNEYTVTLENVTTIQSRQKPTVGDESVVMLGSGVIVGPDMSTNPTIVLNGDFKQYNWVTEKDAEAVTNSTAKAIIKTAVGTTVFNHTVNGYTASNLGIIFMNNAEVSVSNSTGLPYGIEKVSLMNQNGQVYSLKNAESDQIFSDSNNVDRDTVQGDFMPTFEFDLGNQAISYDGSEDTRYLYGDANGVTALYQDGDDPITLDLSKLATIYKYTGQNYEYTAVCKDSSGNTVAATNNVVTLSAQGSYTLEFEVKDNIFYDEKGEQIEKEVSRTFVVPLSLTVKAASVKNAVVNITKTALDGEYNTVNLTDYELRIKFLDCISITDYDNKGTGTTVNLSSNISSATLTPSSVNVFTTASTITITYTDGRVLTVNLSKISGSSPGTKTAKVNTSGSVYFTTEGALNNKPTEESSQNKCTITSVSYKGNSGSTVTNDTDVTVTWALGSSSSGGCITGDTLVTLADGTQKRMDEVKETDMVLVFDHETGTYAKMPLLYYVNDGVDKYSVINLHFSDYTTTRLIDEHALFNMTLNRYVYIREDNCAEFIGHKFAKDNGQGGFESVTLTSAFITEETVGCYSITSLYHLNYYIDGMLSLPGAIDGLFNYFEYDPTTLRYDQKQMKADIEEYGLYTYEDFADHLTEEMFENVVPVKYLKVAVGKGLVTFDELLNLIYLYLA